MQSLTRFIGALSDNMQGRVGEAVTALCLLGLRHWHFLLDVLQSTCQSFSGSSVFLVAEQFIGTAPCLFILYPLLMRWGRIKSGLLRANLLRIRGMSHYCTLAQHRSVSLFFFHVVAGIRSQIKYRQLSHHGLFTGLAMTLFCLISNLWHPSLSPQSTFGDVTMVGDYVREFFLNTRAVLRNPSFRSILFPMLFSSWER